MGKQLDENRKKNNNKIRIGVCLELHLLFTNFDTDFNKITNFIKNYSKFLTNQNETVLLDSINDIQSNLNNLVNIILCDIDKNEEFCKYHSDFY